MHLSTVSANIPRSRSHARTSGKAASEASSTSSSMRPPPPPPRAVQSMLRSTTELGDIGQLPLTRSHRSRSIPRLQSTRRRSGSFDSSFASALHHQRSPRLRYPSNHHGPRHYTSESALPGRATVRSSLRSHQHYPTSRNIGTRPRHHGLQGLTDSTIPARSLYSHRSLVTLRSYGESRGRRSSSPLMNSAQRPTGYRMASPVWGPGFGYSSSQRPPLPRVGSRSSAASSPASMYPARSGFQPGNYTGGDQSFVPLARWPSPAVHGFGSQTRMGHHISRHGTPSTGPMHGTRGGSMSSFMTGSEIPKSPTDSLTPRYYDYSESFIQEEQSGFDVDSAVPSFSHVVGQPIPEDQALQPMRHAQTPFGTRPGSTFHPVELPTNHNRRPSEHSASIAPPTAIPARRSSLGFVSQATRQDLAGIDHNQEIHETDEAPENSEANHRRFSSASRWTRDSSSSSIFFSNASRSPRDLTALVARVHSPREEERQQIATSAPQNIIEDSDEKTDILTIRNRPQKQQLSSIILSYPSPNGKPIDRPQTSPVLSVQQDFMIISPRPERPLSSQSRRQFSRILEIDEQHPQDIRTTSDSAHERKKKSRLSRLDEKPSPRSSSESMTLHTDLNAKKDSAGRICGDIATPNQDSGLSPIASHGKSTVESLLDHHIESLGLGSGSDSPSHDHNQVMETLHVADSDSASTVKILHGTIDAVSPTVIRPVTSGTCRPSSLDSDAHKRLIPRRLFSSMDARFVSFNGVTRPFSLSPNTHQSSNESLGWRSLTSDSRSGLNVVPVRPSILSGDLADVDTNIQSRRFKVRRRSHAKHNSSLPEHVQANVANTSLSIIGHGRSQSEVMVQKESQRRRGMRVHMKLGRRSNSMGQLMSRKNHAKQLSSSDEVPINGIRVAAESHGHSADGLVELSGDSSMPLRSASSSDRSSPTGAIVPTRWSSIVAAMPTPGTSTGRTLIPRQTSFRTNRSHRSVASLAEPVNSTRMGSLPPSSENKLPRLEPSNPRLSLTRSHVQPNIPFPGMGVSNGTSLHGKKCLFNDRPDSHLPKTTKMKFGLSSLRSMLPRSSPGDIHGSLHGCGHLPMSRSCQMQGRNSTDDYTVPDDTVPMSDFAYRKRKVMQKLSDWWHRQCMQKRLPTRKTNPSRNVSRGLLVVP